MLLCSDAERLELIKAMREEGMTLQEIADMLGYKYRSSVSRLLREQSVAVALLLFPIICNKATKQRVYQRELVVRN